MIENFTQKLSLWSVVFVLLFIMFYIWFLRVHYPRGIYIIAVLLPLSHFLFKDEWSSLGLGYVNLFYAMEAVILPVMLTIGCLFLGAIYFGTLRQTTIANGILFLFWYVLWGTLQQYVLNGFFTNRLVTGLGDKPWIPILVGGIFCIVHLPNWFLMVVTLIAGFLSAKLYLRYPNIYVLGISHALIGWTIKMTIPDSTTYHMVVGPNCLKYIFS